MKTKHAAMVAVVMAMAACGGDIDPPRWAGTFRGPITHSGSCDDGSALPTVTTTTVGAFEFVDGRVTWADVCGGTAVAIARGNTAAIVPYACPTKASAIGTLRSEVTGGTLFIDGDTLEMTVYETVTGTGRYRGRCTATLSATLTRQ